MIHHAPFPVIARASWGFWGSYIAIVSRAILATFWFAIQTMNGAYTVRAMIGAIWPSFLTLPSRIPAYEGIDDALLGSFVIFWVAQLPFLLIHPNKLRWLFLVKSVIVPISWIAILIWALTSTRGSDMFDHQPTVSGSAYSWAFLASMNSVIGNYATLSVNQADFSRYSKVSVKWQCIYVPLLPAFFTFISFIGIASASAGNVHYGVIEWDPIALISHWSNRPARFFAAASFALAALGVNISANSLSAANDFTALFPRYVNIRRGQLLCAVLAWALVPWKILASAGSFLNFMSAYAIFLGPIAAIMLFDFWVVHRRRYDTMALYHPESIYRYNASGINWRAVVAFLVGIAPSMPGFVNGINPSSEVGVGVHPYQIGWLIGFCGSAVVYTGLSIWVPAKETFIDRAVLPDEIYAQQSVHLDPHAHDSIDSSVEVGEGMLEKPTLRQRMERLL